MLSRPRPRRNGTTAKKPPLPRSPDFHPGSTAEFELAAQFAIACLHAKLFASNAHRPGLTIIEAQRWASRSDAMMRQSKSDVRMLLRLKAESSQIAADPERHARSERTEHHLITIMTRAISRAPSISPADAESHTKKIETTARQPSSLPPALPNDITISRYDPKSHRKKPETPPRQPNSPQPWRVARPGFDIPYPGGPPEDLFPRPPKG